MTAETDEPTTETPGNESTADAQTADAQTAANSPEVDPQNEQEHSGAAEDSTQQETVEAHVPQFANLQESTEQVQPSPRGRLYDVSVQVAAELGNVRMPIGEILQLGEGSVLELNRSVSEPIDLMAQGVRIARGEVVVIDDCFAIRIKEIESSQ